MKKLLLFTLLLCGMNLGSSAKTLNPDDANSYPAIKSIPIDNSKIVVFADPHVMAPELLVEEGSAWTTYLDGQRKLVDYSQQLFDEMINRIVDLHPGLVLIPGDLTKDGEKLSHQYVISKLEDLRALGIKTLVVPGNHDRGSNSDAVYYNGASTTPAEVADNDWFATQYANYGYGEGSERLDGTLTYACEPIPGLVVIGIDSGTDGVITTTTLCWVVEKAIAARTNGKKVIAMMHHPLIPHFTGVENFVETAVVASYGPVRNRLADAGIRVVFTGHFHTSDIAMDKNADLSREIYDVNTGSLVSYPCDYRVVTLNNDMSELIITTGHISELTNDKDFAETAKERLTTAVKKKISAKGFPYSLIAETAAKAFIFHAEGNEPDNPEAASTLSSLVSTANMGAALYPEKAQAMINMATSMLQDISQYGDSDRENVTNDLTLNIELPEMIKLAADGYSTYCSENRLDISKTTGLTAYIVSDITASAVVLKTVSVIPAETGFIVNGTGSAWYELLKTEADADDVSDNQLHGTLTATDAPANTYALSTKNNITGFYPVTPNVTIPAHKAYLTIPGSSEVKAVLFDGITTEIHHVEQQKGLLDGIFYNLAGQRVLAPTKGMYIVNGKKVLIK